MQQHNPWSNKLRADLYTRLLPEILKEDLEHGVDSYVRFWDDPVSKWDEGFWDEIGVLPVIKNMFYAIEREEVLDLQAIDDLTDLVDPNKCPEEHLDIMARSLGHPLEEGLTESEKREVIKSIIPLNKVRGRELSWLIFYRMLGFKVQGIPLWKKEVYEDQGRYSRTQYETISITNEHLGTAGLTDYSGTLVQRPILPGSIRVNTSGKVYRDNGDKLSSNYGDLIAADGSTGSFHYVRGKYVLSFSDPTTTDVYVDYEHITEEYPYRAARVDLEVFFYLDDEDNGSHPFDQELLDKVLARLEEVRPIHVLVRLVVLILDAPEKIEGFATDLLKCGPHKGKDVRDNEYRFFAVDYAEGPQDGPLIAIKDGTTDETLVHLEDPTRLGLNPDTLTIEFSDGSPTQHW